MKRAGMEKQIHVRIKTQNCDAKERNAGILHVKQEG